MGRYYNCLCWHYYYPGRYYLYQIGILMYDDQNKVGSTDTPLFL